MKEEKKKATNEVDMRLQAAKMAILYYSHLLETFWSSENKSKREC